ncbi:hypothetical protein AOA14_18745 [Sphingopyxis terrae subsp. terrae NBRC 15098]|uniref:UspA domain-containing protein n=1 Tax=Sphingopyxis terrae subsp. terrae NBRC 15098 TaxID=1219058 RepID=A0A142W3P1_9SPHN|nr:universal stress protein [Sphingopyxis terrae]AMU96641.1 hypothetical protein AOA14_18745 [Sphingopyxis terrae subsp. terrae NBRC 15098]
MFTSLLLPIKLNELDAWTDAFAAGCRLARDHDARLTLATIIPHWVTDRDADYSWEAKKWFERRATAGLEALRSRTSCERCDTLVHWGSVPGSFLDMAEEVEADLIVMPARKPGIGDYLRTQAALRLAARVSCSVLLVRDGMAVPSEREPCEPMLNRTS